MEMILCGSLAEACSPPENTPHGSRKSSNCDIFDIVEKASASATTPKDFPADPDLEFQIGTVSTTIDTQVCRFFQTGICSRAKYCLYAHDPRRPPAASAIKPPKAGAGTYILLRNVDPKIKAIQLRNFFMSFGDVVACKVGNLSSDEMVAEVQFLESSSAERALAEAQGATPFFEVSRKKFELERRNVAIKDRSPSPVAQQPKATTVMHHNNNQHQQQHPTIPRQAPAPPPIYNPWTQPQMYQMMPQYYATPQVMQQQQPTYVQLVSYPPQMQQQPSSCAPIIILQPQS